MWGYVYAQVIVEGSTDIPVVTALMYAAGWADSEFSVTSANGKGVIDRDTRSTGKPLVFSHTSSFVTSIRTVRDAP